MIRWNISCICTYCWQMLSDLFVSDETLVVRVLSQPISLMSNLMESGGDLTSLVPEIQNVSTSESQINWAIQLINLAHLRDPGEIMEPCIGSWYYGVDILHGNRYDLMKHLMYLHLLVINLSSLFVRDQTLVLRDPLQPISRMSEFARIWWGSNIASPRDPECL